ncbi:MAG: sulfotransferase domain-containing protein [Proteobacteria bacterium]|nr:sulfotransferase domain-containing protein [Pseudomonadota bacterium]
MKRQHRIIALALPREPEPSSAVVRQLAEFVQAYARTQLVCLLDLGGASGVYRTALGAERCIYVDCNSSYLQQHCRWEIVDPGLLSGAIRFVVVLAPPATYLAALRTVYDRFPGRPIVILPFAGPGHAPGMLPPVATAPLGDDSPIVFSLYPGCGSNRLRPVVRGLMFWLEKRFVAAVAPNTNRRFLASIEAPALGFGDYPKLRCALDDACRRSFDLLDLDCWSEVHDHVSTDMLAQLAGCKVVALYRDPRDYIVSLYHWLCDRIHRDRFETLAKLAKEDGLLTLIDGLASRTAAGDSVYQVPPLASVARDFAALRRHPHILAVSYEEARLDPRPLYRRMIAWLGLDDVAFHDIPDEGLDHMISLGGFAAQSGGVYTEGTGDTYHRSATLGVTGLRKGIVGDWKNHFSPKLKDHAKELIGESLIELGYEKDLNW